MKYLFFLLSFVGVLICSGENLLSLPQNQQRWKAVQVACQKTGWEYVITDNFFILTDLENPSWIGRYKITIERVRKHFQKVLPPQKPITEMGICQIFKDQETFKKSPFSIKWSKGTYSWQNVISIYSNRGSSTINYRAADAEMRLDRVLVHETWHQYNHQTTGTHLPTLLNEGLADYFKYHYDSYNDRMVIATKRKDQVRQVLYRIRETKDITNGFININRYGKSIHYVLGYAMCYYILHGAHANGHPEYSQIITKYFDAIRDQHPDPNQFAWEGINQKAFWSDLFEFWSSSKKLERAAKFGRR